MIFKTISSLFLIVAIVCILDLRPQQIAVDVLKLTVKKQTIRDQAKALRTGKKKKTIGQRLLYVQTSMAAMGRESKFAVVVCASLVLFVVGAVIGVLAKNVFLAPTFAAFLAAIPFVYVRSSLSHYEKHIAEELETTLSIITTSYARSGNLIKAVQENIGYIKPPLKEHFSAFLGDNANREKVSPPVVRYVFKCLRNKLCFVFFKHAPDFPPRRLVAAKKKQKHSERNSRR